ncbi:hypothetical protein D3C86_1636870 [compost metagenome]
MRDSPSDRAVNSSTGIWHVTSCWRTHSVNWIPSIPGIITSEIITSGTCSVATCKPISPFSAVSTLYRFGNARAINSRSSRLSSTTRIVASVVTGPIISSRRTASSCIWLAAKIGGIGSEAKRANVSLPTSKGN